MLRLRIANALLRQRWRAWSASRQPVEEVPTVRELELSAPELRVLQLHGALAPGYTLSPSEVAQALRARKYEAEKLVRGLHDLGLLNRTLGGMDDETSYTLSAAGRALLAARAAHRRPPKQGAAKPQRSRA
jgi:DNA-binding MarR family transcriptional regulator